MDQLQTHIMWPNLPPEEPCKCAQGNHPTFTKLCPNSEASGFHLFSDTYEAGAFSTWVYNEISDPTKAMDKSTYEALLSHFLLLSVGTLHDKEMQSFCILGKDQAKLVGTKQHSLHKPLGVRGVAGNFSTSTLTLLIL